MVAMLQPIMGIRNRIAWRTQGGLGWTLKRSRCRETPKSKRRTEVIRRWMEDADPGVLITAMPALHRASRLTRSWARILAAFQAGVDPLANQWSGHSNEK